MNKRAQGLPMNFIIIAALAVIVLIIVVIMVIIGGSSFGGALSPAQHSSRCGSICLAYQKTGKTTLQSNDPFCVDQELRDGTTVSCEDTDPCYITKADGTQTKLTCGTSGGVIPNPGTGVTPGTGIIPGSGIGTIP